MPKYIAKTLVTPAEIKAMCERLGREISQDYAGEKITLICVLKGAVLFLADLIREISVPLSIDFMSVSSYSGTKSSGVVRIIKDLDQDIAGKHVILVEDIVDSGLTLQHLCELLSTRNPASIKVCTAFDKPMRRNCVVEVDYCGIQLPDEFVVGYGLDYEQEYRNLPYVAVLAEED